VFHLFSTKRMSPKFKKFIASWAINTLAVAIASSIVPGIHYERLLDLLVASLLLGVLNSVLKPILMLVALPLLVFTLGLFMFVINALLLFLVGSIVKGFHVNTFWAAFWGALIISVVSVVLNSLTGNGKTKVQIRRGNPPPRDPGPPGGNGPVIDV
jgi:putative membrane protein